MKYPALDVDGVDEDFLVAAAIEFNPSAVATRDAVTTIYFPDSASRDRARDSIARAYPTARFVSREVDDEDWARRSQKNLQPVRVGRIVVTPFTLSAPESASRNPEPPVANPQPESAATEPRGAPHEPRAPISIVIVPSRGFGTGHHATTRLCLAALQTIDVAGLVALDVGTGSGVLAIAARLLGARKAVGIDNDPDAIEAATENLEENPQVDQVVFRVADLLDTSLPTADVITANLTGALLVRSAPRLLTAVQSGGRVIVSGLLRSERRQVVQAFAGAAVIWEAADDEWVALQFQTRVSPT